jgi:hypothetical protein
MRMSKSQRYQKTLEDERPMCGSCNHGSPDGCMKGGNPFDDCPGYEEIVRMPVPGTVEWQNLKQRNAGALEAISSGTKDGGHNSKYEDHHK